MKESHAGNIIKLFTVSTDMHAFAFITIIVILTISAAPSFAAPVESVHVNIFR